MREGGREEGKKGEGVSEGGREGGGERERARVRGRERERILKLWSVISRCHTLILKSSAERYVASSLLTDMELMW